MAKTRKYQKNQRRNRRGGRKTRQQRRQRNTRNRRTRRRRGGFIGNLLPNTTAAAGKAASGMREMGKKAVSLMPNTGLGSRFRKKQPAQSGQARQSVQAATSTQSGQAATSTQSGQSGKVLQSAGRKKTRRNRRQRGGSGRRGPCVASNASNL